MSGLIAALWLTAASPVTAQIVSDATAVGSQRPTILNAPNNVPLVNIQTPSAAGVSRNSYSQFDVLRNGAILNNSRTNTQTQLGGWVQGNPWLATGSARVILNEVNSSNPSQLNGFVEVAGQRAQVVVANPAGLSCDGCGFINASRVTLTTGTPLVNAGSLDAYRVTGGAVSILGAGMDSGSADYTDIITRAVSVNAGIWANQLKVVTGTNQVSIDAGSGEPATVSPIAGTGPAPMYAIDTAALGGMYANKIFIMGTEAGVGIRHAGTMYAGVGDVMITADGQLVNRGSIHGAGDVRIDTQAGVANEGSVHAQGKTQLTTRGSIGNTGSISAQGDLALLADGFDSRITSGANSVLGAGVAADGSLTGTGNFALDATRGITAQGQLLASGDQRLTGALLDLSNSQIGARTLSLTASGDIHLANASAAVADSWYASTAHLLRTDQATINAARIELTASTVSNVLGRVSAPGPVSVTTGTLDNRGGLIQATAEHATLAIIAADHIDNSQDGKLFSSGSLAVRPGSLDNRRGQISSGATLLVDAVGEIDNREGLLASNRQLDVRASRIDNRAGMIASTQDRATITAAGSLNNRAGHIEAARALRVAGAGAGGNAGAGAGSSADGSKSAGAAIDNSNGTMTGSSVVLDSHGQSFLNTGGRLIATGAPDRKSGTGSTGETGSQGSVGSQGSQGSKGLTGDAGITGAMIVTDDGSLSIQSSSVQNQGGQIQGVGNLTMRVDGVLDNSAGLIRSGKTTDITAIHVSNAATRTDTLGIEGTDVTLAVTTLDNRNGAVRSNNDAIVSAAVGIDNSGGLLSGERFLTLQNHLSHPTLAITNTDGTLIAGRQLDIHAASLSGDGQIASLGDMTLALQQDFRNRSQVIANGNASIATAGTFTNEGMVVAGNKLRLQAASIDNLPDGTIKGNQLHLAATGNGGLRNRGLVDGIDVLVQTPLLDNLGSGRLYGDYLAIATGTLNNLADKGIAPVIAARERLDIAADTLNNRDHGLLFSAGDLAIGAQLDASHLATGQAQTLHNASATIEALGTVDIHAATINNSNLEGRFETAVVEVGSEFIHAYQGDAQALHDFTGMVHPTRYRVGTPGLTPFFYQSWHLLTPETPGGYYEEWDEYKYQRQTSETRITRADPGQILSGGSMRLTATTVNNDLSRIIAGGDLLGQIGTLNNIELPGQRTITEEGTVDRHWRDRRDGDDVPGLTPGLYRPAPIVEDITLTPSVVQARLVPTGTGTQIAALSPTTVTQSPTSAGTVASDLPGTTPLIQVAAGNSTNDVIRSASLTARLPDNRLYHLSPAPGAHYLVETDPAFASYRNWISSDYLLTALKLDTGTIQKRLGDGFHEQGLIRDQVAQLTGRRFLAGYTDDEAQYQALMNHGATVAQSLQLVPGIALSAQQMASLTSDIVWLVEQTVTLPDGSSSQALVPQLYVRVKEGDLQSGGALMTADKIELNVSGNLLNGGTIAGRRAVALTADNIHNLGGRILGQDVGLAARTDLHNIAGAITANDTLTAIAGRDVHVESSTNAQTSTNGSRTHIARVAGLYVTGDNGNLTVQAGRDVNLTAAVIGNGNGNGNGKDGTHADAMQETTSGKTGETASGMAGRTTITAGNNIILGTLTQSDSKHIAWDSRNQRTESSSTEIGTRVQSTGHLALQAGNDLVARAATITSEASLTATAGNDIHLLAGQQQQTLDQAFERHGRTGGGNKLTTTSRSHLDQTTALGTTLSGETTTLLARHDIHLTGSNVVSDQGTTLAAQNDIVVRDATSTTRTDTFRSEKRAGLMSSGGFGVTVGSQQQSVQQAGTQTTSAASTVGSTAGNVNILAGRHYTQSGSDILAPQGDIDIHAQAVTVTEGRETSTRQTSTEFKQSGLTVAVTSPVITAIQTAEQMSQAASHSSDPRMKALAAANAAMVGKNTVDALQAGQSQPIAGKPNQILTGKTNADGTAQTRDATTADKLGGINLNISLGSTQSSSNTTQTSDIARPSTIAAGNNVRISATGAAQDSKVILQGTDVKAGNTVSIAADNDIRLLAARNASEQHSSNQSRSASIGMSIGTAGMNVTASASRARGNADDSDVSWHNTHVDAGKQASLRSGADTVLQGAVVSAPQISSDVGRDLRIESLQDTSQYAGKQKSLGGSISLGTGMSGSLNIGRGNINSDYASVTEQSGLKAGDPGFKVDVARDTTLKGGAILSEQAAIDQGINQFRTGGALHTSDIDNRASYSASSVNVNLGTGFDPNGKLVPGGTSAGLGKDGDSAASTTRAAISGIAGDKEARTGNTQTGIAPIFDAEKVQKEVSAQVLVTQLFGREAPRAVASYAANKVEEIKSQLRSESNLEKRKAMIGELQKWEEGGDYRTALHAAVGGISGNFEGAIANALTSKAAPILNDIQESLANSLIKAGSDPITARATAQVIVSTAAAGLGGVVNDSNVGAVSAFNTDSNNRQLHPTETQWITANASRYASLRKISLADAERQLAQQAYRQVQEGVTGEWDNSASIFLKEAHGFLQNDGRFGPGVMFQAWKIQKSSPEMYAETSDSVQKFYDKNNLRIPTTDQVAIASERSERIRNSGTNWTIAAPFISGTSLVSGSASVLFNALRSALEFGITNPSLITTSGASLLEVVAQTYTNSVSPASSIETTTVRSSTAALKKISSYTEEIIERQAVIGSKLDYFLGLATGNKHNIDRSREMLRQLEKVGLPDTISTREYLLQHLSETYSSPISISEIQKNGRSVRESLLVGPLGAVKLETIWEGNKLITGTIYPNAGRFIHGVR